MSEEMKTIEKKPVRRRAVKKTEPAEQEIISAETDSEEPAAEETPAEAVNMTEADGPENRDADPEPAESAEGDPENENEEERPEVEGILEIADDGFGFLRFDNFLLQTRIYMFQTARSGGSVSGPETRSSA